MAITYTWEVSSLKTKAEGDNADAVIQTYAIGKRGFLELSLSHEEGELPLYARKFTSFENTFSILKNLFIKSIKENEEIYEKKHFQTRIAPFMYM